MIQGKHEWQTFDKDVWEQLVIEIDNLGCKIIEEKFAAEVFDFRRKLFLDSFAPEVVDFNHKLIPDIFIERLPLVFTLYHVNCQEVLRFLELSLVR